MMHFPTLDYDGRDIFTTDGRRIAEVVTPDPAEQESYSRLFAAAPDLLGALRSLLAYEDDQLPEGTYGARLYREAHALLAMLEPTAKVIGHPEEGKDSLTATLREGLGLALDALNQIPRHPLHGGDSYTVAAKIAAILKQANA